MEASAGLSYKRRRVSLDTSIKHIVVRISKGWISLSSLMSKQKILCVSVTLALPLHLLPCSHSFFCQFLSGENKQSLVFKCFRSLKINLKLNYANCLRTEPLQPSVYGPFLSQSVCLVRPAPLSFPTPPGVCEHSAAPSWFLLVNFN